jgi:hypothetical protein
MKKMMILTLGLAVFSGSTMFAAGRPVPDSRDRARHDVRNEKRDERREPHGERKDPRPVRGKR